MAKWICGCVLILLFLGFLAALDRPERRYLGYEHHYYVCQVAERSHFDVVTLGSSRTLHGVGPAEIGRTLSRDQGEEVAVCDLSRSWRGQGVNYTLLRDFLERHTCDVVLVELNLHETGRYHAHWFRQARWSDLIIDFQNRGRRSGFGPALQDFCKLSVQRCTYPINNFVSGQPGKVTTKKMEYDPRWGLTAMPGEAAVNEQALAAREVSSRQERYVTDTWYWDPFDRLHDHDTGFLLAMRDLARSKGIEIYFFHVQEYKYKRLDRRMEDIISETMDVPLFIPPNSLQDELDSGGHYADSTHMTESGRKLYSEWLATKLLENSKL